MKTTRLARIRIRSTAALHMFRSPCGSPGWRDPCMSSIHMVSGTPWTKSAVYGIPSGMFKSCLVDVFGGEVRQHRVRAREGIVVLPDEGLIPLECDHPMPEGRFVSRGGSKHRFVRYVGKFSEWSAVISVRYDSTTYSRKAIVDALKRAGENIGVGHKRPPHHKSGTFKVA